MEVEHKMAILGDMRELGPVSHEEHLKIIQLCDALHLDAIYVGAEFSAHQPAHCYPDADKLNEALKTQPITDSLILVKGSNSMHLDRLSAILQ